jgi:hypothetical protein
MTAMLAKNNFLSPLIVFLILFLIILCVYYPSFKFDFIYDDFIVITEQPPLTGVSDVFRIFHERNCPHPPYYRPIVRTTLLLQKTISGNNPAPFHQCNVFLLWIAAVCVYWLLRQPPLSVPRLLAFMVSCLFVLHPVTSASVYPVTSGRENLLPGIFMILAIISYFKKGRIWFWGTVTFFSLALFGREQAVMLLPLFILGDILRKKGDPEVKKIPYWFKRYTPMIIILFIYMQVRLSLFGGSEFVLAIFEDPLKTLSTPLYAFQSIFAPFYDEVYEPKHIKVWLSLPRVFFAMIPVGAIGFGMYSFSDKGRFLFIFWGSWFVLSILPTANVIIQEAAFSERYILQAYLAILVVTAFVLAQLWHKKIVQKILVITGIIIIVILAAFTTNRGNFFKGNEVFYKQWIKVNPDHPAPYLGLSRIYLMRGELDQALHFSSKAVMLKPNYMQAIEYKAIILGERGEYEKAVGCFNHVLAIDPNSINTHYNLGVFYLHNKEYKPAIERFKKCIELDPMQPGAYYNLGLIYEGMGKQLLAKKYYRKAYFLNPRYEDVMLKVLSEETDMP